MSFSVCFQLNELHYSLPQDEDFLTFSISLLYRNIKRIVFSTLMKFDGQNMVQLTSTQAKQIAGRAGRYGSDHPNGEALT